MSTYETNRDLKVPFSLYSQLEKSIYTRNKNRVLKDCRLLKNIELCESLLSEKGRLLVRPSGTEEVIRVLVEGENPDIVNKVMQNLTKTIELIIS